MQNEYITVRDAAHYLGVSVAFLNKRRIYGGGPEFVRFGRSVRYTLSALQAYAQHGVTAEDSQGRVA